MTPVVSPIEGDIATLYRGPGGVLKLARDPADNDLIVREAGALQWLAVHGERKYLPYVPTLLGTGGYRDPATRSVKRGNALKPLDGFRDLAFVARRFPAGLDPRDVAWIWRRLLVALGFAHRAGIVHGAVLPPHVLIETEQHGLTLVDWCYATGGPQPGALPAIPAAYRDWYPPEVRSGYVPGPAWTSTSVPSACCTFSKAAKPRTRSPASPKAACWPTRAAGPTTRGPCWPNSTSFSSVHTARAGSGRSLRSPERPSSDNSKRQGEQSWEADDGQLTSTRPRRGCAATRAPSATATPARGGCTPPWTRSRRRPRKP